MTARVLLIGGMDSSGGAGLARDIATASQMGADTCVAVTAVTAQTDGGVRAVQLLAPEVVAEQIRCAGPVDAIKIGMLGTAAIVDAVARALPPAPLVVDPVLASSSGHALLDTEGRHRLISDLLPRTSLLTPNLPELSILALDLGLVDDVDEGTRACAVLARGCGAVLVKGGHAEPGPICEDRLYGANGIRARFSGPRHGVLLRGTGCQLASAIAVALAQGIDLEQAVTTARHQVNLRFEKAPGPSGATLAL